MYRTPKVVLYIAWQKMVFSDTEIQPNLFGFEIGLQTQALVTAKVCDIKSILFQLEYLGQELPGVSSCFDL